MTALRQDSEAVNVSALTLSTAFATSRQLLLLEFTHIVPMRGRNRPAAILNETRGVGAAVEERPFFPTE